MVRRWAEEEIAAYLGVVVLDSDPVPDVYEEVRANDVVCRVVENDARRGSETYAGSVHSIGMVFSPVRAPPVSRLCPAILAAKRAGG